MKTEKNNFGEKVKSLVPKIIETFEEQTGITNHEKFNLIVKEGRYDTFYFLVADVNNANIGILANNLEGVKIRLEIVRMKDDNNKFFVRGDFRYHHKDGGSNGCSIMNKDGWKVFAAIFEI